MKTRKKSLTVPSEIPTDAEIRKNKILELNWKAEHDEYYVKDKKLYELNKVQVLESSSDNALKRSEINIRRDRCNS